MFILRNRFCRFSLGIVEQIGLPCGGERATAVPLDLAWGAHGAFDRHVSLHRFDDPESCLDSSIRLEEPPPAVEIPLLADGPGVTIDLRSVFDRGNDAGPHFREFGHGTDPWIPPLGTDRQVGPAQVLKSAGHDS